MSPLDVITVALGWLLVGWIFGYTHGRLVKGRAPGLSEHAAPFGQTEARAERTLEHPPDKSASAGEEGAAPPPRAPEPPAARVG